MRLIVIASALCISLLPAAASAQSWKEWHHSNPTYPSPNNTTAPAAPSSPQGSPPSTGSVTRVRTFLDQKFIVPAKAEWSREIVARASGTVKIRVTADAPKSIIVLTTKAWKNLLADNTGNINKETEVFLVDDTTEVVYERDITLPPGSYMIMMENRAETPQEFHLQCSGKW